MRKPCDCDAITSCMRSAYCSASPTTRSAHSISGDDNEHGDDRNSNANDSAHASASTDGQDNAMGGHWRCVGYTHENPDRSRSCPACDVSRDAALLADHPDPGPLLGDILMLGIVLLVCLHPPCNLPHTGPTYRTPNTTVQPRLLGHINQASWLFQFQFQVQTVQVAKPWS